MSLITLWIILTVTLIFLIAAPCGKFTAIGRVNPTFELSGTEPLRSEVYVAVGLGKAQARHAGRRVDARLLSR